MLELVLSLKTEIFIAVLVSATSGWFFTKLLISRMEYHILEVLNASLGDPKRNEMFRAVMLPGVCIFMLLRTIFGWEGSAGITIAIFGFTAAVITSFLTMVFLTKNASAGAYS